MMRALCVLASADAHYRRHIPRSPSPVHRLIVIVVLVVLFGAQRVNAGPKLTPYCPD